MDTRLVAYSRLGSRRGVLPFPHETTYVPPLNELPTLVLKYPKSTPEFYRMLDDPSDEIEIAWEYSTGGTVWHEPYNARFKLISKDHELLDEVPVATFTFIGIGEVLRGVHVYQAYNQKLNDEGKVSFKTSTPGNIMATVWDNGESRGWTGYQKSFTSTVDSAGKAWANKINISYAPETSLDSILNSLVRQGLVDYVWEGRTLHLYNPNTHVARDLSKLPTPVRFAGSGGAAGVDNAPEMLDASNLATHIVVIGEGGLRWVYPTGTIVPEGRREIFLTYSGVDDEGTARILAAPHVLKAQNVLKNTTRQFHLSGQELFEPFVDYRPGDWAEAQRAPDNFEKLRIVSMNILTNQNGTQGYVTLGDKVDILLEKMYQRIQGLTGGIANEGTGPVKRPPRRTPMAPHSLIATAHAFVAGDGSYQGLVGISFVQEGVDTAGNELDIQDYLVYYRDTDDTAVWSHWFDIQHPERSGSHSPLPIKDEFGNLRYYDFMVKARSTEGIVSAPSEIFTLLMETDQEAPPTPTAPDVTTWLRTVTVRSDGKGISPSGVVVDMPADTHHFNLYSATDQSMTDPVFVSRLTPGGLWQSDTMPAGVTVWYALTAVDGAANESEMSAAVSITPVANVNLQEITDKIDGAMMGENSITYVALQASEELWTRVLGAHKILAGEIDTNNLTSDTGFIGSLRTGLLTTNWLTAEHIDFTTMQGKQVIGGDIRTEASPANTGGGQFYAGGLRFWDTGGNLVFNLTKTGTGMFAGKVQSGFGEIRAELNSSVFSGRPGMMFRSGSGHAVQPFITSFNGSTGHGIYEGALHLSSARGTFYSDIYLGVNEQWNIGTEYGRMSHSAINGNHHTSIRNEAAATNTYGALEISPTTLWLEKNSSSGRSVLELEDGWVKTGGNGLEVFIGSTNYMRMQSGEFFAMTNDTLHWMRLNGSGLSVSGGLNVSGSKNFVMDHPTKPGMELLHGSTESPVSGVEYWGSDVVGTDGTITVVLPEYFEALAKPEHRALFVSPDNYVDWTPVEDGKFTVTGPAGTKFSWLVKAERYGGDFEVERLKEEPPTVATPGG